MHNEYVYNRERQLRHVSTRAQFKKVVKWVYGACQVSTDWGKFKLNAQFQLGACQMVNLQLNRVGAEGGEREYSIHKLYNQT